MFDLSWITFGLGHEGESDTGRPGVVTAVALHKKQQKFVLFYKFSLNFKGLFLSQPFGKTLEFLCLTAEGEKNRTGITLVSSCQWRH